MYKGWWWPGLTSWSDSVARIPPCFCHLVWALDTCWGSWDTPRVQKHLVCKHTSETSPSVASNVCRNPGSAMCLAFQGIPVASKCADSVTINIINTERIWSIKNRLSELCNLMIQAGLLNDISMLRKVSMNPFYIPLPDTREDWRVQREPSTQAPCSQYHVCVPPSLEFGPSSIESIDVNTGYCRHGSQGGHPQAWTLKCSIPLGSSRLEVAGL